MIEKAIVRMLSAIADKNRGVLPKKIVLGPRSFDAFKSEVGGYAGSDLAEFWYQLPGGLVKIERAA